MNPIRAIWEYFQLCRLEKLIDSMIKDRERRLEYENAIENAKRKSVDT
jgi:hypothetical protein